MKHLRRGNKLWEGSRMFLPEHRHQLLLQRAEMEREEQPERSEEQILDMERLIQEAMRYPFPLTFWYLLHGQVQSLSGFVQKIDIHKREITVANEDEIHTLSFDHLIEVKEMG